MLRQAQSPQFGVELAGDLKRRWLASPQATTLRSPATEDGSTLRSGAEGTVTPVSHTEDGHGGAFATTQSVVLAVGQQNTPNRRRPWKSSAGLIGTRFTLTSAAAVTSLKTLRISPNSSLHRRSRKAPSAWRTPGTRLLTLLLKCAQNFLADEWGRAPQAKRGGAIPPVPPGAVEPETRYMAQLADTLTPEQAYEEGRARRSSREEP